MTGNDLMVERGRRILRQLIEAGHSAYFVGGCVRDEALGRPLHDIDIATDAKPEQVIELFERTVPTGLKHGTVTVLLDDMPFEVTTFRTESAYEDHRRPARVEFVSSLETDLMRRDFTMNAMAMDAEGRVIDPFGGMRDIAAKLVRCVGRPAERFDEDALRMLRCVRFAAEYGFDVDPATWDALRESAPLMRSIAMERVRAELERIVEGSHPQIGLRMFADSGLIPWLKRDIGMPEPLWRDAAKHAGTGGLTAIAEAHRRWAFVCIAMELRPQTVGEALRKLTFPTRKAAEVSAVCGFHRALREGALRRETAEQVWKLAVLDYGRETACDWLALVPVMFGGGDAIPDWASLYIDGGSGAAWLSEMPAAALDELPIGGQDLIRAGFKPGKEIGQALAHTLRQVALGAEMPTVDELIAAARRYLEQMLR